MNQQMNRVHQNRENFECEECKVPFAERIKADGSGKKVLVLAVWAETQAEYIAPKAVNSHSSGGTNYASMSVM